MTSTVSSMGVIPSQDRPKSEIPDSGETMIIRNRMLCSLPVVLLVWTLLQGPAQALFVQQGHKLVGAGAVGGAQQGVVSLSRDGNTAIVGGHNDKGPLRPNLPTLTA
jgi:hypothetical protein